ncbi:probable serine/threonine-protein kinase PBL7 isoform X2 [Dendrobium catenatum]|uniref:probable serine/threonine-protein kinase PBL7 isoform X2 n=1 Tax=Dendrobium catenatum TaxID=906689 RepID=UPI00109F5832|nr:probable serine/threonine-protein kinase PBL7 isoform X2 [Dendrobium catenatum]
MTDYRSFQQHHLHKPGDKIGSGSSKLKKGSHENQSSLKSRFIFFPAMDSVSEAPRPFLHLGSRQMSHKQHPRESAHGSNCIACFILPIMAAAILMLLVFLLLFVLRRAKRKTDGGNSFGKKGFDETKQVSRCSSDIKINGIRYSPDVRSCLYGSKLSFAPQVKRKVVQVFTYKELEQATDGFSERNLIENGGFGVLYRGVMSDGTAAAVKLLQVEGKQGEKAFRMEVDLLSRLQSHYLVILLGYCADQHHRLLVFEDMPNGCLQQHLHPTTYQADKPYRQLDWKIRLKIALDCARGLEFLHEHSIPPVIHRDFKSSNILLDHNFSAKVSDFGIAKSCSYKVNGQVQTRVVGTTGYVAPDRYAATSKLTTKSDVYSYGVVLLELLTGRVPVDITRPQGEHVLVSWALPRLTNREKVIEMVDPALQGQYSMKELIQVAAIASVCVQSEADYRPLITDVVQSLIPLVKNTHTTCYSTPARFKEDQVSIIM